MKCSRGSTNAHLRCWCWEKWKRRRNMRNDKMTIFFFFVPINEFSILCNDCNCTDWQCLHQFKGVQGRSIVSDKLNLQKKNYEWCWFTVRLKIPFSFQSWYPWAEPEDEAQTCRDDHTKTRKVQFETELPRSSCCCQRDRELPRHDVFQHGTFRWQHPGEEHQTWKEEPEDKNRQQEQTRKEHNSSSYWNRKRNGKLLFKEKPFLFYLCRTDVLPRRLWREI